MTNQATASQSELNRFVKVVDEFKAKYAKLITPAMRAQVLASNNQKMISDYENAVSRGGTLNRSIDALVGAWSAFKRGYASVTNVTSTVIGDAIDTVRGWFGYVTNHDDATPGMGSLGLIQIPAAIAIAGIIGAALVLIAAMNRIFIAVQANRIQKENPSISRAVALRQAEAGLPSLLPSGLSLPMIAAGVAAAYFILGSKK